ncbi:DNA adenine methylase [Gluconacetobacter sp. 1b LMG 1731]|uniref:site-specific DNA-methyltransferase (adenine-specific) n=1 Tax=Gluconacetobacter dulcium TaxID=2729096 RepID=A0A7W4IKL1_9PROT|nr:DNA adenine methylase [Gluconacetobacter dulcium]MBB2164327.1 DNA adenine methylase [Gluconacetobacter dulcium]MBB2193603.1 DNA adenine methylase [Gluconacetobacter dulcium]
MHPTQIAATPVQPIAPYLGGKRNLAGRIIKRIAEVEHTTYVEPFIGMGGVFLRRPFRAKSEVINDVSRDVATLFRVLQHHYVALMDMLRFQLTSRAEFERLLSMNPYSLTDLHRAARFLYVQRLAFGGKIRSRNFGVDPTRGSRFDVTRLAAVLDEVHQRLSSVVIECLPYDRLIGTYDRPGTLFYLDPPYWGCERDYGAGVFASDDFERLATILGTIKGSFILSINDVPEIRRIFAGFKIESVSTTYTVGGRPSKAAELMVMSPSL